MSAVQLSETDRFVGSHYGSFIRRKTKAVSSAIVLVPLQRTGCNTPDKSENSVLRDLPRTRVDWYAISATGVKIQCVYKWMVQFQKLTRNLFLTLHGQNVHRQQRQLSKFRIRYQQFAFHAYCGAEGSVSKMASQQEKAFCVLRFEVSRSVITVQREFRAL